MRSHHALYALILALGPLACAGGDPVKEDRFGSEDADGGDDGTSGTSDGQTATSGDPGGTTGDTSGDPTGSGPTSSGSGASSGGSTSGSGSSSSGSVCNDSGPGEPNDSEGSASNLGELDDCDASGGYLDGVLAGDDVDWYVYHGGDAFGCMVDPSREIEADGGYRVCKFVSCDSGEGTVTCPAGTSAETSPDGRSGCCAQQAFELTIDCPGLTDSASVYVRVDKPPAYDCVNYKLTIHY
jgi:hypothetical protein